ncbi:hypothetical protein OGAPHI_007419 [Ogataea philodendri]|uniref:Uncharacterized protein n=1 Tax=Ogataea philodendri TaxID=1378263 RepID=A0A9P8SZL2_9ASCO|nr:uncharacterized protein OGAPHI_007419 [Ogataea philodendri]KAH3660214.1 hypothetical protein OGAPHI_007419 [Ogataea philodendri]
MTLMVFWSRSTSRKSPDRTADRRSITLLRLSTKESRRNVKSPLSVGGVFQRAEKVTNVVGWSVDGSVLVQVPVVKNVLNEWLTGNNQVLDSDFASTLADLGEEVNGLIGVEVGVGEIGSRSHHNDSAKVNQAVLGSSHQSLQSGIVLLLGSAVGSGSVGQQVGVVGKRLVKVLSEPVVVGSQGITCNGSWGSVSWSVIVLDSELLVGLSSVQQVDGLSQFQSSISEILVDLENFGSVDLGWVLGGVGGSVAEVAGGPVGRHFPGVDFVLQNLDSEPSKGHVTKSSFQRRNTCNSGNQEVGVGQVEGWVQTQSSNGGCGIDFTFSGDNLTKRVIVVAMDLRIDWRKTRNGDIVNELELLQEWLGLVAEHVDDENLGLVNFELLIDGFVKTGGLHWVKRGGGSRG